MQTCHRPRAKLVILNCTIRPVLHEWQMHGRANSSQHPTRGRSLARRFRGSHSATLRVALPARKGRTRVSSKSVGRAECVPHATHADSDIAVLVTFLPCAPNAAWPHLP